MSNSWMVNEEDQKPAPTVTPSDTSSGLPFVSQSDTESQVFRFYWLDAYEDYFKHPGLLVDEFA